MRTAHRALGLALVALLTLSPACGESVSERSTRALLDGLDDRQMPDVMLWVIERAAADPSISEEFKAELPFRRAGALVGVSRTEGDAAKRAAYLDDAEKSLDTFLATSPAGDLAITAYTQKGTLLIDRGQKKLDQAQRPGQDAAGLSAEALAFFDAAIRSLKGTVKPEQKEITAVTNAEDAIIQALREVDAKIAALTPADTPKKKPLPRRPADQQKALDRLEESQRKYQGQLLATRILVGAALFEKSKACPPGSKEAAASRTESTELFKGIAEKYAISAPTAATYARYYWGRNLAAGGMHESAADILAPVVAIDDKSPVAVGLKAKAANTSLECWLAMVSAEKDPAQARKILERVDEGLRRFVLTPAEKLPGRSLDGEWLALKYRAATALAALADRVDVKERQARGLLQRDARKLAIEVATANKDFAKEARELAGRLGKELPDGEDEKDVAAIVADARVAYATFQEKQAEAKQLQATGKAAEASAKLAESAADRDAAMTLFERAVKIGEADPKAEMTAVNTARSMLAFLYYDAKRYGDAAAVGTLLLESYPNFYGSKQAARVSLASLQQLALQPDPTAAAQAKQKLVTVATSMGRTWPAEPEGADAYSVLLNAAIEAHAPATIEELLAAFPTASPRRAELAMRAGTALRREAQEARKREANARPPDADVERWNSAARTAIDEGLASLEGASTLPAGPAARIAVSAALTRVQMALEEGDRATAGRLLEHPLFGPWTAVTSGDPALSQGQLAEGTLTVALRHFIETEQFDKAQRAMEALETAAGPGAEASAKLTNMYLAMGRDLQGQLEALGSGPRSDSPEVRERATKILQGFEKFLDGVATRDAKISSQVWVATTYLTLGSGRGTGSVVPRSKAEQYLDRSAEAYARLLARKDDPQASEKERGEAAAFEPSIRLKMANIYKERGKWAEAQQQLDWILADQKRQNSLEIQVQAAELLEAAGRAAGESGDGAKADAFLREAAVGRTSAPAVIWGWGGIANKLSRQAFSGSDEKSLKAREMFFRARLHVAEALLARARLNAQATDRSKRLDAAKTSIAMTRKLYPDLGGEDFRQRFEQVLKEIQKDQGAAIPGGFTQLDEEAAAAATP